MHKCILGEMISHRIAAIRAHVHPGRARRGGATLERMHVIRRRSGSGEETGVPGDARILRERCCPRRVQIRTAGRT
jgi:hypothetical protein